MSKLTPHHHQETKNSRMKTNVQSYSSRNTQIPNLLQHLLNPNIQLSRSILLPRIRIQILLHLCHPRIRLRAEPQLNLHQRFKRRVQIRNTQRNQLRQLGLQLLIQLLVRLTRNFAFLLHARQLGGILVGLLDKTLHLGANAVVVLEASVALFDAFVYVGEVGAEAGYWVKNAVSGEIVLDKTIID